MALITRQDVQVEYGAIPEDSSKYYISLFSMHLSDPYELADGDQIKGEITSVKQQNIEIPELSGREITFILQKLIIIDRLYIAKADWKEMFRERGLVYPSYSLTLKLTHAIRLPTKKKVELYTQTDLKVF